MSEMTDVHKAEISERITEMLYDYAVERCKQTVFYEQVLADGAVMHIENASHAEKYRTNPILPCGYRDRSTGQVRMVKSSRRCTEAERDSVFWDRHEKLEREEFPFDDIEPVYFTQEQIADQCDGEVQEVIDWFLYRVSTELPQRYKKEAKTFISHVLAGLMTAPIAIDELRRDITVTMGTVAAAFFESVEEARAKYTPKRYRAGIATRTRTY